MNLNGVGFESFLEILDPKLQQFVQEGECYIWTGKTNNYGYPYVYLTGDYQPQIVHQIIFNQFKGSVNRGNVIDHKCRLPLCSRPEHLRQINRFCNTILGQLSKLSEEDLEIIVQEAVEHIMARNTVDLGRAQRLEQKWSWIRKLLGDDNG